MGTALDSTPSLQHADRLFIGGEWVKPSSSRVIDVINPADEEIYFSVADAQAADVERAVGAARQAFDDGPWTRLSHAERGEYLRAMAAGLLERADEEAQMWPRQSGALYKLSKHSAAGVAVNFEYYAGLATTFAFEESVTPTVGNFGLLVREPVGVVGAIIPWNAPLAIISNKIAPALLAGCTVVLKCAPEAPGEGLLMAEVARAVGLPPGVFNVITADRQVSELLVSDPRVDKISFTGSTAAGRRIASLCGERIARCSLELGGKSAAVILDDADIATSAKTLARAQCHVTGQVCASLTRIVVGRRRQDELLEALAENFARVRVGDPFDPQTHMGPLAARRQRDRVMGYIAQGIDSDATLVTGGHRPEGLDRGWYVEPTVFGNVDNSSVIAREEIFGPVLSVIPADNEAHAIAIANDSIYGLNAAVFTDDVDRAVKVARQLRSGTVGHNGAPTELGLAFGGFKHSGLGREGGTEGLLDFLETKTVILDGPPAGYDPSSASVN